MNELLKTGFQSHGVYNLTPAEALSLCAKGAAIVDVREEYMIAFKMFRVERIFYMPYSRIEQLYDQLPRDIILIFADSAGLRSRESVLFLKAKGFENIANMAGGFIEWEREGLPVNTDLNARLSGSCMCQLKPREAKRKKS